jgi:hypothetical protein
MSFSVVLRLWSLCPFSDRKDNDDRNDKADRGHKTYWKEADGLVIGAWLHA